MWRLASAAMLIAVFTVAAASSLTSRADTPTPSPDASASASPSPAPSPQPSPELTPEPSSEPLPPTPPPAPPNQQPAGPPQATLDPAYSGTLRPGDWVQVTGTGACLNARSESGPPAPPPGAQAYDNILNCLPDGFVGRLEANVWGDKTSLPVQADGRWWWRMLGQGWVADEWLTFHHQGGIPWPERPDLADAGLIAYMGNDGGIWLMNADGSNQREIVTKAADEYFYELAWSAAGDKLAFTVNRPSADPASGSATRVIALDGSIVAEYAGLTAAVWSPVDDRLSALRVFGHGDMMGYHAVPVVVDAATGIETAIGPHSMYDTAPSWSPDSSRLAFVCTTAVNQQYNPDGTVTETRMECGGDGLRTVNADGSNAEIVLPFENDGPGYGAPTWSPDGVTLALSSHWSEGPCRGRVLFSLVSRQVTACFELPPPGGMGGRCGGPEDVATDWSPDGSKVLYHWEFGAGRNGVFIVDVATGQTVLVPFAPAWHVSLSDGQNLAFGGAGYIWVAGLDGSNLTLLAEGNAPAWQPLP